ncbi:unnamed protein product [Urochloa decumbens]|uniref:Uncharacterized protein n=1 Tax=Urochloa decumbens TaxID=240449 RepID=A0ABC8W152_9POAL
MQLPITAQPAGLALNPLKPIAARRTVPSRASYERLLRRRRTNHPSQLHAPCFVRRMGHRPCPVARTKARDDGEAEPEPQPQAPAKEGEEEAAVERSRGGRSLAYQIFEAVYLCAYVLSWRIGELIAANAQDAVERLRRYVLGKFNRKR